MDQDLREAFARVGRSAPAATVDLDAIVREFRPVRAEMMASDSYWSDTELAAESGQPRDEFAVSVVEELTPAVSLEGNRRNWSSRATVVVLAAIVTAVAAAGTVAISHVRSTAQGGEAVPVSVPTDASSSPNNQSSPATSVDETAAPGESTLPSTDIASESPAQQDSTPTAEPTALAVAKPGTGPRVPTGEKLEPQGPFLLNALGTALEARFMDSKRRVYTCYLSTSVLPTAMLGWYCPKGAGWSDGKTSVLLGKSILMPDWKSFVTADYDPRRPKEGQPGYPYRGFQTQTGGVASLPGFVGIQP
jgi:hypothetical protein